MGKIWSGSKFIIYKIYIHNIYSILILLCLSYSLCLLLLLALCLSLSLLHFRSKVTYPNLNNRLLNNTAHSAPYQSRHWLMEGAWHCTISPWHPNTGAVLYRTNFHQIQPNRFNFRVNQIQIKHTEELRPRTAGVTEWLENVATLVDGEIGKASFLKKKYIRHYLVCYRIYLFTIWLL